MEDTKYRLLQWQRIIGSAAYIPKRSMVIKNKIRRARKLRSRCRHGRR